jgi:ribosomal protein S12 methylthiotransferase accessory factor
MTYQPTFQSEAVTEPNNFVEHFIDSSGLVSWRFFSAKSDYDFVEWDFTNDGENSMQKKLLNYLAFLKKWAKKSTWLSMSATACRILVPDYSEIYLVEDLIWDNTNKALAFREDILNIHRLDETLEALSV